MAVSAVGAALSLICSGSGHNVVIRGGFGGLPMTSSPTQFEDQAQVEISGGEGRIRVPPAALPELASGSKNGWWTLKRLVLTEREIAGRVTYDWMNTGSVRIDRVSGHIVIDNGRAGFTGQCEAADPNARPKF